MPATESSGHDQNLREDRKMILITGGQAQGKRAFWEKKITYGEREVSEHPGLWVRGSQTGFDELLRSPYVCEFHLFIRRLLSGDPSLHTPDWVYGTMEKRNGCLMPDRKALAECLLKACPGRVLVTDEIGLGIVPLDPFEREYREETGRICCLLAAESEQVWRVVCGLGQRLK